MSSRIDQRIVEMSFENHKFEKGINQSKNSLREFSNALKNMGTGKDFGGLESSVQSVTSSFSMLEQVGIGALRRIGEAAVNAGASLVKSLTVDQLSAGIDKYQEKIEAVQTMVSAGYDLDTVEKSMEQLMWFSDETSYSFADMAGNMAKFISAGVDIKTSEKAMQGIATWAAHSGKNSQAASIAMFNLSQAISMGYVDTLNWRSIMNQNMNTTMFKEIAIGVAEATGAIKEGQVTIQNFDSNLKDKWFTNDVLLKTLEQYSSYAEKVKEVQDEMGFDTAKQAMDYMDANADKYSDVLNQIGNAAFKASQESKSFMDSINATMDAVSTGWMRTYEIIFGTLYEAKENFSALTEVLWTVFASSAEGRNEMLQLVKDAGGIKSMFQIIKNVAVALLKPLKAISQAFDQFFPPRTVTQWMGIINMLETITRKLIISDETASRIQRTFAGFFAVLDIGWETVKFLGSALYEIINIFVPLNGNLLEMTASVGDFLVMLNHLIKQSGVFQYGLLGVKIAAMIIRDTLTNIVGKISEFVHALWTTDKPLELIGQTVQNLFSGVLNTLKTIITWVSGKFKNALSSVFNFLSKGLKLDDGGLLSELLKTLKEFIEFIINEATGGLLDFGGALEKLDFSRIATFVSGGVLLLFVNQLSNLTKSMSGLVNTTNSFVTKFSKKLFGTTTKIKDLAYTFGILSASLYVLSRIPWEDMKKGLIGLAGAMLLFVGAYGAIQAITVASSKALNGIEVIKSTLSLKALAAGLLGMTLALGQISKISEYDVWRSVGVLGALMGLVTAYQALSAVISLIPGENRILADFKGLTFGLVTLVGTILILNFITPEIIANGLNKISSVLGMLVIIQGLFALAARVSGGNKLSVSLLGISAGILGLIGVIKILSVLNISEMSKGIKNVFLIGGILSGIQFMFSLAARVGGGVKFKANIFSMTMGLTSMVVLLTIMDKIGQAKLQNGIGTITKMAGIIVGLEIFTALAARIGGGHKLQKILGAASLTMISFTALIGVLGVMKPETIDKGLNTIKKMMGIILGFQALVALTGVLSKGASGGGFAVITGMVAGVLTVTASLILLSMQDQTALTNAAKNLALTVAAVGIMSAGIGLMMRSFSGLSTGLSGLRAIVSKLLPGFAAMGVILIATLALIQLIKVSGVNNVEWDEFGKFAVGMGALTALAVAFTMLTKVPGLSSGSGLANLKPGLAGMAAVVLATAGLFKAISWVLDDIKNIEWNDFGKFMVGLGVVGALSLGIGKLSIPLAALGPSILPVLGGVLTAIGGVALIVLGFAGLADIMETIFDSDTLIKGIDKLVLMGEGIGRFVGAIASGFNKELIIGYGEGLAGFAAAMGEIDPASFDGVESLAKALLILTATSILDGLSKFVNSGKNPGEVFGAQIKGLIKSLSGITADDATTTTAILSALAPMTESLKKLAEAMQSIPESGGLAGIFAGNNDVDDFGGQIKRFIKSLAKIDLADAIHTSDVLLALAPMLDSLKGFIGAAGEVPNSNGMVSWFTGDNNIDEFGGNIRRFIKTIGRIEIAEASHTSNVLIALSPMVNSLKAFIEASSTIPNKGGMVSWFTGDNSIDDFAKGVSKMVKAFEKIDMSQIQSASDNIQLMADDMLPSLHKFVSLTTRLSDIGGPWDQSLPLLNFATTLKEFVKTLSGVDVSVVGPALKSLEDITTSFKVIGAEVLESAKQSFENNKQPFQTSIVTFLDGIIKEVDGRKGNITRSFETIFTEALKKSKSYITEFKTLGSDIIKGLKEGINRESPSAESAIGKVVNAVTMKTRHGFQVESPSKVFSEIGGWLSKGLGHGIERNANVAVLAAVNMGGAVEEGVRDTLDIHSFGDIFPGIGKDITGGLGYGMESVKSKLLKTANDLGLDTTKMSIKGMTEGLTNGEGAVTKVVGELIDSLTGGRTVSDIVAGSNAAGTKAGGAFVDGVSKTIGSSGSKKKVAKSAAELADEAFAAFKKQMDYLTEYDLITPEEEISKWEEFWAAQVEGSENWLKAEKKVNELRFQYSKNWIDREKYYKRLALADELAAWERVQAKYKEGHDYRLQAEREIFRVKQEISQLDYQNALDFIEESKYYGRMNLTQELREWKKIINITQEASEERKRANREVYRLENEIREANLAYEEKLRKIESDRNDRRIQAEEEYYSKVKEINDRLERDIQALTDAYENAVESRAKTLYSTWGLFDKVDPFQPVDGNELFKNLEDQVVAFDQWQAQIGILSAKGVDEGLIKELRDMGPKSLPQILALNKMTDTQLNGYVALWKKKSREAKDQAVYELQDMKEETNQKIQELTDEAEEELRYYKRVWKDTLRDINNDARRQLDELEREWTDSIGGMTDTGISLIQQFRLDWFGEIQAMIADTRAQMAELQRLTSQTKAFDSVATAVRQSVSKIKPETIGKSIVAGVSTGVKGNVGLMVGAGAFMANTLLGVTRKTLGINSPSKEFMEIGQQSDEGLAAGLRRFSGLVSSEGASVGRMALEAVSLSMNSIPDLLGDDVDAFTITPVLDLTNVRSGMYDIHSLFNSAPGLGLGADIDLLPTANVGNQNGILAELKDALLDIKNQEVDLSGVLTVQVVNDKGEIVDIAETAIKDILRRESR